MLGCPSSPQPSLSRGTNPDTTTPSITPELLLLCLTRGFLRWCPVALMLNNGFGTTDPFGISVSHMCKPAFLNVPATPLAIPATVFGQPHRPFWVYLLFAKLELLTFYLQHDDVFSTTLSFTVLDWWSNMKQNCGVEAALNIMTGSSAMVRAFFPPRHVGVYLTLHFFIFQRFAMAIHTTSFSPFNLCTGAINTVARLPIFMSSAPRHYKTPFPAVPHPSFIFAHYHLIPASQPLHDNRQP
ncbi:hypothetical protein CVT26_004009 [Gymnopilus dilepis]|uniref:Uncharacterized protein n=1 Tax=Gymnopilus dilepis TaxID=231916 RepID=A0A409XB48_9AGAR|nr:hypothetical protein CVT26_004009 [Gymnopilus dilepis]